MGKLDPFIRWAEPAGLPVKLLKYVQANYKITVNPLIGASQTVTSHNTLELATAIEKVLRHTTLGWVTKKGSGSFTEKEAVDQLYHEATHAYLDLKLEEFARVKTSDALRVADAVLDARIYYIGAKITNADNDKERQLVSDINRVVTEAAAEYVGTRAAAYWLALDWLTTLQEPTAPDRKRGRLLNTASQVITLYNDAMRESVFGYQAVKGKGTTNFRVDKPIPPKLKKVCDDLLEDKLQETFMQTPRLRDAYFRLIRSSFVLRMPNPHSEDDRLHDVSIPAQEDPAFPADTLFKFDSAKLTPEGEQLLRKWIDRLNRRTAPRVILEAHTDSTGRDAYNFKLSRERGLAVKQWFMARGVKDAAKFEIVAKGETQPITSNNTAEGRARNRRVYIRFGR